MVVPRPPRRHRDAGPVVLRAFYTAMSSPTPGLRLRSTSVAANDPAVRRLFPTAFPDDPERQREYADLTRDFLEEHHRRSLTTLAATTGKREVDGDEIAAWLSAINDIRLVLGTRLDVTDGPGAGTRRASDDPYAPLDAAYNYLGWLQAHVIDAVAAGLPDAGLPGADDAAPS